MKKFLKAIISFVLVVSVVVGTISFSFQNKAYANDDVEYFYFNGHTYAFFEEGLSWTDANERCKELDGHLVTITSDDEQSFLTSVMEEYSLAVLFYFIGGYKESSSSSWRWVTGEPFSYSCWGENQTDKGFASIANFNSEDVAETLDPLLKKLFEEDLKFKMKQFRWHTIDSSLSFQQTLIVEAIGGFICEWDYIYEGGKACKIAGRTFNKNIDYYVDYVENGSSSNYNPQLSNMCAALSVDVYSKGSIKEAYESLGFNEYDTYFGDYDGGFDVSRCGYVLNFKKSDYSDETICLVSVRGSVGSLIDSDWISNLCFFTLQEEKHTGFALPAYHIYKTIQSLIESRGITGNIIYVITGHSRGAAVANLLSVKLMEEGVPSSQIYNYNFACPDVARKAYFPNYSNIFNICNRADIVPYVPGHLVTALDNVSSPYGTAWGKFGKTYWFTKEVSKTDIFKNHDRNVYLEFTDRQSPPSKWGSSASDVVSDTLYKLVGTIVKVFCPVDVEITDKNGRVVASIIGNEVDYYYDSCGNVIIFSDGDRKVIYVNDKKGYNVQLIGNDVGEMTYSVEKYNMMTNEVVESKTFENVELEVGKTMYSPLNSTVSTEDVELQLIDKTDEKNVVTHMIQTDGTEKKLLLKIETPKSRTINYGETITLKVNKVLPESYKVKWEVEGNGVQIKPSFTGDMCDVTAKSTGNVVVRAYVVDEIGRVVNDENGNPISNREYFYSEANLWLKIVYFFKRLFGR